MRARLLAVALVALACTGCAFIVRSSVPSAPPVGLEGNRDSGRPSLGQGGRFVAFESDATNLVAGDTNGVTDVFVRDHLRRTTTLVSVATDGTRGDARSGRPAISDDGRFVAFETEASTLFPGDADGNTDIVVRDVLLGTTSVASIMPSGAPFQLDAVQPTISGNGRLVAFHAFVEVSGLTLLTGPYVRDLVAGTTRRMPTTLGGGISPLGPASLSDDGALIVYGDAAPVGPIGDGQFGVVLGDTATATIVRNVASGGLSHQLQTQVEAVLSGDGQTVALLVRNGGSGTVGTFDVGDPNAQVEPLLDDLHDPRGLAISDDASVVALALTFANGGNPFDGLGVSKPAGAPPRNVAADMFGHPASSVAPGTDLAGNGRWVAFASADPDLVPFDTNAVADVFVRSVGH